MITIWADCETTGLDPLNSGAFEFAFLVYRESHFLMEKVYHLNPLNENIVLSEEAYKINGVSEETIRSYPPAEEVILEIVAWLTTWLSGLDGKMVFAGFCCDFDYRHSRALLERFGYEIDNLFSGRMIDVYELVKRAYGKGIIKYTPDKKLETICKSLRVPHEEAHTALSDIWATRRLYETIYLMERKGR
jgi:DNA polymerase III epsilon subunit-like protein